MKSSIHRSALVLALMSGLGVGCGSSQAAEPASGASADPGPGAPDSEGAALAAGESFDDLEPAQKLKYMKQVVAPQMAKTFQAYDAEHYAEFGCVTCHGPGAKDGNFEMPTSSLPKLPADPTPVFEKSPEVAKFMAEQVVPQMAKLLGEQPYNPETHQGFGCFDCHQKQ